MRRLAIRRFPDAIVRRRQARGAWNEHGEFEPGAIVAAVLPALIQPVKLEDTDTAGGSSLIDRLRVYVPTGIERVVGTADSLRWGGDSLRWGGDTGYISSDRNPLAAAFDDRDADEVEYGGLVYIVEESQLWRGSYCRAVLLRET